jgi:hypothetical protein
MVRRRSVLLGSAVVACLFRVLMTYVSMPAAGRLLRGRLTS